MFCRTMARVAANEVKNVMFVFFSLHKLRCGLGRFGTGRHLPFDAFLPHLPLLLLLVYCHIAASSSSRFVVHIADRLAVISFIACYIANNNIRLSRLGGGGSMSP